jgi:hypothetical protein
LAKLLHIPKRAKNIKKDFRKMASYKEVKGQIVMYFQPIHGSIFSYGKIKTKLISFAFWWYIFTFKNNDAVTGDISRPQPRILKLPSNPDSVCTAFMARDRFHLRKIFAWWIWQHFTVLRRGGGGNMKKSLKHGRQHSQFQGGFYCQFCWKMCLIF